MKLYKKYAFSLTELLIVLVVLAVLFAALAPIITKRRSGASVSNESVWNYVSDDDQMDSFYDPGVPGWTSTAFIGLNPNLLANPAPLSKVVIKAGKVTTGGTTYPQRQIQFRYGSGNGVNAGSLFIDDRDNMMLSGNNDNFVNTGTGKGSTIAGIGAFQKLESATYSVAYGPFAMTGNQANLTLDSDDKIIAVGNIAGRNIRTGGVSALDNIFLGSGSGRTNSYPNRTIALGSNSMSSETYAGNNNIFLGYDTGSGQDTRSASMRDPSSKNQHNVIAGSSFPGKIDYSANYPRYNTVLGYDVYASGNQKIRNLTAIGYGACNSVAEDAVNDGKRTCIGYFSGGKISSTPDTFNSDKYEHIFLGGMPQGFGGRSVLEVHNQYVPSQDLANSPDFSPTVVLNSNLVVRGNQFLPYNNGRLASFRHVEVSRAVWERTNDRDHCKRWGGMFGRRKWRHGFGWRKKDPYSRTYIEFKQYCNGTTSDRHTQYNLSVQCPQLGVYSDLRLKANLSLNEYSINKILLLNPYKYTYKADKNKEPHVGVVAQELQKVFPNSVSKAEDGYLRIRWDEMFYAMINSIKFLNQKIEKIASDISDMESDILQIKSTHRSLHKQITALDARTTKLERK